MDDIGGRVALVTGASRGIGRGAAIALAEAGCPVALGYNRSREAADQAVAEIENRGGAAIAVQADMADTAALDAMVDTVEAGLGPVEILVNNAGINPIYPLGEIDVERWNEALQINLTSGFVLCQRVVPGMRERGWGRLIMMSSVAAHIGGVIGPHYAASKAGQLGLMRSYARMLATEGVTSNAIAPALIETDMIAGNDQITPDLIPVKRFGRVDEVSDMVVHLARNAYMNGQTINIDGGMYMS
ncbi:SDR family NAD(P)-dependent oxidoreductase [Salinisphaera sp. SPP-AMP-43]|uniref:SDR family NAD(P)-dependent oxidoreductase n=1 Tax=Salinisphaera sp. SPP-AMP-43 TaxID=3121288 RepID=UPI003C6E0565